MLGNLPVGTIAWLSHLLVVGCIHVQRHAHAQQGQQEQRENRDKLVKSAGIRRRMSSEAFVGEQICEGTLQVREPLRQLGYGA